MKYKGTFDHYDIEETELKVIQNKTAIYEYKKVLIPLIIQSIEAVPGLDMQEWCNKNKINREDYKRGLSAGYEIVLAILKVRMQILKGDDVDVIESLTKNLKYNESGQSQ